MATGPHDLELQVQNAIKTLPSPDRRELAICVRGACKDYGSKKDPVVVLNGLDMTVPKGIIYGLLGASGCGKTTLLNCIVGRRVLDSGDIWVLGGKPRTQGSGVPGPQLGYMPQELALYGEFTIHETLRFYAWVNKCKVSEIEGRIRYLRQLLMLPEGRQTVNQLSLGQQRRTSLACALVHKPELLILDEPTVGADPLLRHIIWEHFLQITKEDRATIIITTHYIDETRQAQLIGLMRAGNLLAEESPEKLLAQTGLVSLEEVFLKLSLRQNRNHRDSISEASSSGVVNKTFEDDHGAGYFGDYVSAVHHTPRSQLRDLADMPEKLRNSDKANPFLILDKHSLKALLWKNFTFLSRNISALVFVILLPIIQIAIFCVAIGHDPEGLAVAVVNHESSNFNATTHNMTCNSTHLGSHYLNYLGKKYFNLIPYEDDEEAARSVLKGKTYASIVIKPNYSIALRHRIYEQKNLVVEDLDTSTIEVVKDSSSVVISTILKVHMFKSLLEMLQDYLLMCGFDKRALALPIQMEDPVYGANLPNFTDFITSGLVLAVTFSIGVALTAGSLIIERKEGNLERYLVIGIREVEILTAHVIVEFLVLTVQIILTLIFTFYVFNMTIKGSITLVLALGLLVGFCGMCFGFLISAIFKDERTIELVAMGCLLPILVLCGIIWPVEGMHWILKPITPYLPLTYTSQSLRSILERGWDLTWEGVYIGFLAMGLWTVIFIVLTVVMLRYKGL